MREIPGREVISTLEKYFKLEWFKYRRVDSDEQLKYPPVIVWRYDSDTMSSAEIKKAEKKISTAINCFSGKVKWEITFSGRNWVLLPLKVKKLEMSGEYRTEADILTDLAENSPDFGIKANEDIAAIAQHLAENLEEGS